jgi:hypothetical protein
MALGLSEEISNTLRKEVKAMHGLGWREFLLADDICSSDNRWATSVCEAVCQSGIAMAWSCKNRIRMESADWKLFDTMRCAITRGFQGCEYFVEQTIAVSCNDSLR